jgi:hypothetical protein
MLSYLINLGLLGDDDAFGGGLVKFPGKGVTPGRKRADENRGGTVSGNYFFAVQIMAVEFLRRGVLILDYELDLHTGRDRDLGRLELMIFDYQHIVRRVRSKRQ